jgi:hypothetical protein
MTLTVPTVVREMAGREGGGGQEGRRGREGGGGRVEEWEEVAETHTQTAGMRMGPKV